MRRKCTASILAPSLGATLALIASAASAQDDTLSWLIENHATTAPATQPTTTLSVSPLTRPAANLAQSGTITLSSGEELSGEISTTPGKPLRLWVEEQHEYVDVPLSEIREIRALVLWERLEREWHFIASGSDVKEYTGKTYPARETAYTIATRDGREITGGLVAPLYIRTPQAQRTLVLNKRNKGPLGQTLAELVYIQRVSLNERSMP